MNDFGTRVREGLCAAGAALLLASCEQRTVEPVWVAPGDPESGENLAWSYGCGTCHVIPGVPAATGTIGPPLAGWASRAYVAGAVPNRPDYLALWIRDPRAIEPLTAMPDLGVSESDARDIAAYLYTLQ